MGPGLKATDMVNTFLRGLADAKINKLQCRGVVNAPMLCVFSLMDSHTSLVPQAASLTTNLIIQINVPQMGDIKDANVRAEETKTTQPIHYVDTMTLNGVY